MINTSKSKNVVVCLLIIILAFIGGCGLKPKAVKCGDNIHSETESSEIIEQTDTFLDRPGFNEYCGKYGLPGNLDLWIESTEKDYETGSNLVSYAFYKANRAGSTDVLSDTTFIVQLNVKAPTDTVFKVSRRDVTAVK